VRALSHLLSEKNLHVRREAAETLVLVGTVAHDALPALRAALKDPDLAVRRNVAATLARLGPAARPAVPELVAALADRAMHDAAGNALAKIGEDALPALIEVLGNEDASVRLGVAVTLGKLGPAAREALKALNGAFARERDEDVAKAMQQAIEQVERKP
jgi:HEAT repeat protein